MAGVTKPYAGALFETAIENGNPDAVYEEALNILGIFRDEPAFAAMLQNPRIQPEDKEAIILKAFAGIDGSLSGLITLMLRKGRGAYIEAALQEFAGLAREHKGIISARVYTAVELSEAQLTELRRQLSNKTGKQAEIEAAADPSLIGGLLIKVGGVMLDSTIKNHLRRIRKSVTSVTMVGAAIGRPQIGNLNR